MILYTKKNCHVHNILLIYYVFLTCKIVLLALIILYNILDDIIFNLEPYIFMNNKRYLYLICKN